MGAVVDCLKAIMVGLEAIVSFIQMLFNSIGSIATLTSSFLSGASDWLELFHPTMITGISILITLSIALKIFDLVGVG